MKKILGWLEKRPIVTTLCLSFIVYFIMESCCRHSLLQTVIYLGTRPHIFLYNMLIIEATLLIGLFFTKRLFATTLIAVIWLILGAVDGLLLFFRTTPFNFNDLLIIRSAMSIVTVYMKLWQLILLGAAVVLLIVGMVIFYRKSPRWVRRPIRGGISVGAAALLITGLTFLYTGTGIIAKKIYNISEGYRSYGFVTCFAESIFVRGVDKPDTYSARSVRDIAKMLKMPEEEKTLEDDQIQPSLRYPNVIYLQLESFFDPNHVIGAQYSANPVPFFQQLKENYTSGYLNVPSFGAGTANTEFEIITGMNLDDFGPGEYPFSTVLVDSTCESLAYNLKERGYTSHLIHNNRGTFYQRNEVYPNLGFDSFTSLEYMNNIVVNPLGWCKDAILTNEIKENLDATEGRDLIYTISVQGHGKYPEETEEYSVFTINDWPLEDWDEEEISRFEYYINQLNQMDHFLEDLTAELTHRGEPTVLVLYGDHLPDFALDDEDLDNGSRYQTEYVVWTNFEMKAEAQDLEAFQLSAYVNGRLSINSGVLTRLHQYRYRNADYDTYLEDLQTLEYDMLYGDQRIYSGKNPYERTDMIMGTEAAYISEVVYHEETNSLVIKGDNFTEWSKVYINNQEQETIFITESQVMVLDVEAEEEMAVLVAQVTDEGEILSSTKEFYLWPFEEDSETGK